MLYCDSSEVYVFSLYARAYDLVGDNDGMGFLMLSSVLTITNQRPWCAWFLFHPVVRCADTRVVAKRGIAAQGAAHFRERS